jgi:hypothetical protein
MLDAWMPALGFPPIAVEPRTSRLEPSSMAIPELFPANAVTGEQLLAQLV